MRAAAIDVANVAITPVVELLLKHMARAHVERTKFERACAYEESGDYERAFRLFKSLALRGDSGAQLNVGYFYDRGLGVRRNQEKALYWYRRNYARGEASGANNIATVYRDRGDLKRAISWFLKAVEMGDDGAALELARIYLSQGKSADAKRFLKRAAKSDRACMADNKEAARLLRTLEPR